MLTEMRPQRNAYTGKFRERYILFVIRCRFAVQII